MQGSYQIIASPRSRIVKRITNFSSGLLFTERKEIKQSQNSSKEGSRVFQESFMTLYLKNRKKTFKYIEIRGRVEKFYANTKSI